MRCGSETNAPPTVAKITYTVAERCFKTTGKKTRNSSPTRRAGEVAGHGSAEFSSCGGGLIWPRLEILLRAGCGRRAGARLLAGWLRLALLDPHGLDPCGNEVGEE